MTQATQGRTGLPNSGLIDTPALNDEISVATIKKIARTDSPEERRSLAAEMGGDAFDAKNLMLQQAATAALQVVGTIAAVNKQAIERHRDGIARGVDIKRFTTSVKVATRKGFDRLLAFICAVIVCMFLALAAEQKTLAELLIASGLFSFVDHSVISWVGAALFSLIPVMIAFAKRAKHQDIDTDQTAAAYRLRLMRAAMLWSGVWLLTMAIVLGPALLSGSIEAADPFGSEPEWLVLVIDLSASVYRALGTTRWILAVALVLSQMLAMSNLVAWIWVAEGRRQDAGRVENVRVAEEGAFRLGEIARLAEDLKPTVLSEGELTGLQAAIVAARKAYIATLLSHGEHLRDRVHAAGTAVLEQYGQPMPANDLLTFHQRRA